MTAEVLLQILTLVFSTIISVLTLLLRSRVLILEAEVLTLHATIASAHALILQQNTLISSMTTQKIDAVEKMPRKGISSDYTANPPYRKGSDV